MRINTRLAEHFAQAEPEDPRESSSAEIIDLTTRNVMPSVTQHRPRSDGLGLAAGVLVVAALGAITLWSMDSARVESETGSDQSARAVVPMPPADAIASPPALPPQAFTPPNEGLASPPPQAVLSAPPQSTPVPAALSNPNLTPTIVYDASSMPSPLAVSPKAEPSNAGISGVGGGNDDFMARLGGAAGSTATATAMSNPKTTVTQGTLIPAILETAIDTDVPGFVRAIVSSDVRSFDGSQVLVPRSSRLIGQYKSGVAAGQKRAYVIWTRLIRPDGASINIASPAVGFGGETGLAGKVNSHFFERFGSAMLLSVLGSLSAVGTGGATIITGGGQSAAAAAVGQSGQIAPTIRVRPGEPVRVFAARDFDFSKVTPS